MTCPAKHIASLLLCFAVLLMASCYPRISPTGPVVTSAEDYLDLAADVSIDYGTLARASDLPLLPFRLWGVDFAEEMLFELTGHPLYAMVEICHVRKRAGEWTWFALVAERDGRQHVAVGSEEDFRIGRSFPAPVYRSGLKAERSEQNGRLVYRFSLALPDGSEMSGSVGSRASGPALAPAQRNGSAMNHSQQTALAVIDLKEFTWAKPDVRIDGSRARIRMLAPFVPYAMRLEQVAGGIAAGVLRVSATAESERYEVRYGEGEGAEALPLTVRRSGEELLLEVADPILDIEYRFRAPTGLTGPMELFAASVRHGDVSVFELRFNPPIPDLRYPVAQEVAGRMVAGVNGRSGYMAGSYRVSPGAQAELQVLPDRPFWACERPLVARFQVQPETVVSRSEVTPSLALDGAGAELCFQRRR